MAGDCCHLVLPITINLPDLTDEGKKFFYPDVIFLLFSLIVGSELSETILIKNRDILLLLDWVTFIV